MTTTDPHPINYDPALDARLALKALTIGIEKLSAWLYDHPKCAELTPYSHGSLGVRQLVYCMTQDEFTARCADLEDGADDEAITGPFDDDEYVVVRRSFGVEVVCDVFTVRRDGAVESTGQAS